MHIEVGNAAGVEFSLVVLSMAAKRPEILLVYQVCSVDESVVNIFYLDFNIASSYNRSKPAIFGCIQLPGSNLKEPLNAECTQFRIDPFPLERAHCS